MSSFILSDQSVFPILLTNSFSLKKKKKISFRVLTWEIIFDPLSELEWVTPVTKKILGMMEKKGHQVSF